jgi:hypothetical protein
MSTVRICRRGVRERGCEGKPPGCQRTKEKVNEWVERHGTGIERALAWQGNAQKAKAKAFTCGTEVE